MNIFKKLLFLVGEKAYFMYEDWATKWGFILWDKPSTPPAPDYVGAANATSQGSLQSTIANALLNRANQNTPYGSQTWTQTGTTHIPGTGSPAVAATQGHWEGGYDTPGGSVPGAPGGGAMASTHVGGTWIPGTPGSAAVAGSPAADIPQFSSNITLSPEQQQLFDANQQRQLTASGNATNALSTPFSLDGAMPAYNKDVADALYGRATSYLDPQWNQSEDKERDRLANSGFSQQDDNYGKAIGNFDRAKSMAYENARNDATTQAGQIGLAQRQQDISERLLARSQPLQELQSLQGATPQMPSFPSTNVGANSQGANLIGATQAQANAAGNIYNADVGSYNSQVGTASSLAMMAYLATL